MRKAATKIYVDTLFNEPSLMKNRAHADFNEKHLNVRFVKVNSMHAVPEYSAAKHYVNRNTSNSVEESSRLKTDPFKKLKLDE